MARPFFFQLACSVGECEQQAKRYRIPVSGSCHASDVRAPRLSFDRNRTDTRLMSVKQEIGMVPYYLSIVPYTVTPHEKEVVNLSSPPHNILLYDHFFFFGI
eukprot:scaffold4494_cov161-Amphora_coffeaeformis.AAC.7